MSQPGLPERNHVAVESLIGTRRLGKCILYYAGSLAGDSAKIKIKKK